LKKGILFWSLSITFQVIKNADWIIDLGPEGGEKGGYIVAEGTPEDIAKNKNSYTGRYLKRVLAGEIL
jgi:excinuclease ABC subunit A